MTLSAVSNSSMNGTSETKSIKAIIDARESTHGDYFVNTVIMQKTKDVWRSSPNWDKLSAAQRESLEMIAHKVGRILGGDYNHRDHWADLAGYAKLVADKLR